MTTKMIVLTVKTLDSQNHSFTVEDDITVEQFKAHIAETVNIPADTQRIIYCGRVLQDSAKLSEYDVNGKVVHLVQRAPPSSTARNNEPTSPQPQRRVLRNFEHGGNGMFLGSMAFPSNFMESQRIVPPPPTHSLAGSRLNVAKRMLRRAEQVICLLENPSARPTEQTPPDEPQDEVTPVIEARVIVPSSNNEPIDEAIVLSAVQNTLLNGASGTVTIAPNASISTPATNLNDEERQASQSSTPLAASSPISVSTENLNSERQSDGPTGSTSGNGLAENASRTSEMAELLTSLTQLQSRFAPFLERYHNFMQEDPVISSEDQRQTQAMLNRVSEVFHYLGHAYHSLSDIIIRIRMPPPRPLLCRPILIQHSAVVQAGIPIQVEAQINLSDRPPSTSSSSTATTTNSSGENNAPSTRPSGETDVNASTESGPQLVGIPYIPTVRVQSFPLEIRGISLPQNSGNSSARPQNNNNNTVTPEVAGSNGSSNAANTTTAPVSASSGAPGTSFNLNNPNVEFFMEVTPEGITIDSLETTLIGSNQADDLLRGALNGHPPDLIQSIMQMAGHIINRNATVPVETSQPAQSTAVSSSPSAATPSGQNSQARGNTQTNPTTSTHTRSTSRPHVHLHQQAMQGGFDPFLPCNSHHVTRRRFQTTAQSSGTSQDNTTRQERHGANTNTLHNIMNGIINSIRTAYQQRTTPPSTQQQATSSADATGGSGEGNSTTPPANRTPSAPSLETLFSNFQPINLPEMLRQGPTIAQLLQQLPPDESYIAGENIITDLIMLISQNLTIGDVVTLNNGVLDPLNRMGSDIQNFFVTRLLDGSTSAEAISRGVDRLLTEMQPFLSNFSQMPVNSDIDMVESVQLLFKSRLPNIIRLASDLTSNSTNLRALVDQLIATANELCALALYASENGLQGVERVFERIVTRYMQGIPNDLQEWTLITSRVHLRQFVCNLNVSYSTLEPYIVRKPEVRMSVEEPSLSRENKIESDEAMELEEQEAGGSGSEMSTSPPLKLDDTETLPNLVIAAEPWHGQVPADWVPIIAKDAQRQRRQNSQPPFSDAYLSGMPSKRRKIVHSSKTQGSMSQIITESVRRAITATGLTSAAPLETVAQAAGSSQDIQVAYRNLLKTSVQATVKDNESFTPERFPNASSYFNNQ